MLSLSKKIIALLILLSFVVIVLFSLVVMTHEPNGNMSKGCPFLAMGASLCPQNAAAMILHQISFYQSFVNIPIGFGTTLLIISLILAAVSVFVNRLGPFQLKPLVHIGVPCGSPTNALYEKKITRWLALHENSPGNL
ncbi:MAG: hypothetical protein AAB617_03030 [Patescibacteria group bacterium]